MSIQRNKLSIKGQFRLWILSYKCYIKISSHIKQDNWTIPFIAVLWCILHDQCSDLYGNGWWFFTSCDVSENSCLSSPCENGQCSLTDPGYICTCDEGWLGIKLQYLWVQLFGPNSSKVYYLQINWLFKSVDYNKRVIKRIMLLRAVIIGRQFIKRSLKRILYISHKHWYCYPHFVE